MTISIKTQVLLILFLIGSFSFIHAQEDNIKENVLGNVKSIRVNIEFVRDNVQNLKLFEQDDDYGHMGFSSPAAVKNNFNSIWYETTATRYLNYYQERDRRDSIIMELWFNKKNEVVEDYRYVYNNNSKIVESNFMFEKDLIFEKYCDFHKYYYEENLLVKITEKDYWADHEHLITYTYDKNKNLINKFRYIIISDNTQYIDGKFYFYKDSLLTKSTPYSNYASSSDKGYGYSYDDKNRLIEIHQLLYYKWLKENDTLKKNYSPYPLKKLFRRNEYDKHDNIIKEVFYNDYEKNNDSIKLFKVIETNYEGNLEVEKIEFGYYLADRIARNSIKKNYNDDRRMIHYQRFYDDTLVLTRTYSYNERGNVESLIVNRKDGRFIENGKVTFLYKYDSVGNWIEQTKSINNKSYYILRRKIEYY